MEWRKIGDSGSQVRERGILTVIYLDNSATTPMHAEVIEVMIDVMQNIVGNPSSLHGLGMKAERLVDQARNVLASSFRCTPQEIIFTSGGTEANNLAIKGVAEQYQQRGRHLITTAVEHASVYETFQQLQQKGWEVTFLPVDAGGSVSPDVVEAAITDQTVLVSVIHVNHEVGTIQPVEEIGQRLRKYAKLLFHVDAVQSFGKIPLDLHSSGIDFLSISAHKLHGPKGVGALYIRKNRHLSPLFAGGGQERGFRAGTHHLSGIVGLAKATVMAEQRQASFLKNCQQWKERMLRRLMTQLTDFRLNGVVTATASAPYILNLSFPDVKAEVLVHALEEKDCYVSSKSACSSRDERPSRVLKAMGCTDEEAISSIRISMGLQTTLQDMEEGTEALLQVIPLYQQMMKGGK
jgi:cysteine desulfurase